MDRIRAPLSVRFESIHDPPGGHTPEERRILSMAYTTLLIKEVIL